jgi:hypothetical protein
MKFSFLSMLRFGPIEIYGRSFIKQKKNKLKKQAGIGSAQKEDLRPVHRSKANV